LRGCSAFRVLQKCALYKYTYLYLYQAPPNVTGHPSTASVPITVLLYNGLLLCGFNVPIKD